MPQIRGLVRIIIVAGTVSTLQAQEPPVPPYGETLAQTGDYPVGLLGGGYSMRTLLALPKVQEELKLTPEQKTKINSVDEEARLALEKLQNEFNEKVKQAREQGDTQAFRELNRSRQRSLSGRSQAAEPLILKVLDRRQRTRLEEIRTQAEGPSLFSHPEVQQALNLAPEHIQQIEEILAESQRTLKLATLLPPEVAPSNLKSLPVEKQRELVKSKGYATAIERAQDAARKHRSATMQKIARILTRRQRESYRKMAGEPFDFSGTRVNSQSQSLKASDPQTSEADKSQAKP